MSAFICARCDGFRDADDGCKEAPGFRLICADCMSDEEEDSDVAGEEPFKLCIQCSSPTACGARRRCGLGWHNRQGVATEEQGEREESQ